MSAYGTFFYCATPQGLGLTSPGAAHTSCATRGRGAGKPPAPLPQKEGRPNPVKGYAVASQSLLDRFPARPLRLALLPHGDGEGSRATKSCILPLTPWNRPNTHRRGRWIGFATRPCGSQVRVGFGAKPQGLVFCF